MWLGFPEKKIKRHILVLYISGRILLWQLVIKDN